MFFIVNAIKPADWAHALFILSHYRVDMELFSDAENVESVYAVIRAKEDYEHDLGMAEMAFQMNWHQRNRMPCEHCEDRGSEDDQLGCGHLTFIRPINPAF